MSRFTQRILHRVLDKVSDLVIVFVGVYAAFALTNRAADHAELHRKHQLLSAILLELESIDLEASKLWPQVDLSSREWLERYAQGEMPDVTPLQFTSGYSSSSWESLVQAGAADVMDVKFVAHMNDFQVFTRAAVDRSERLQRLSDLMILPRVAEAKGFYDPHTHQLKPELAWYAEAMREFPRSVRDLRDRAHALRSEAQVALRSP